MDGRAEIIARPKIFVFSALDPGLKISVLRQWTLLWRSMKKRMAFIFGGWIADLILAFTRVGTAYAYFLHLAFSNGLGAAEFLLYFSAVGSFSS